MKLSSADLNVLSTLAKDPLGTVKDLSRRADMSPNTFSKHLKRLMDRGILVSVSAEICYPSVGLEPILFFFKAPFRSLYDLERILDLHPYTRYRIRCIGSCNGIYALFAIPSGANAYLLELIEALKEMDLITDYFYDTPIARWIYSENNFEYYDLECDCWRFDWKEWESMLDEISEPPPLNKNPPSIRHRMNRKDMEILRYLSINAREKRRVIAEKTGVPVYHLCRRLSFFEENDVIDAYRIIVHGIASKLLVMVMFDCECSLSTTRLFAYAIRKLPFQSTLIPTRRGFFLQTSIPSQDLAKLGASLQKRCSDVRVFWGDYESSMRYWFYHEPYAEGGWIATRRYIVSDVLERFRAER